MFDKNDVAKDPKMKPVDDSIKDKNIGTKDHPKIIKLSKKLPAKVKEDNVSLMKKYDDVFPWRYEYLKEYDTSII